MARCGVLSFGIGNRCPYLVSPPTPTTTLFAADIFMSIELRPATEAEMSQLGLIGAYVYGGAFGDGPDNAVSQNNRPEWSLCAFDGRTMVASFAIIPFTMRALGKAMSLGGITAVGTTPEYRRRGILRRLMVQGVEQMREHQPISALWASQAAIYQRYGYAMTTVNRQYEVDTVDIAFFDGDSGNCEVIREPLDSTFDIVKQLYIRFVDQRLCYLHRSSALWKLQVLREDDTEGPVHVAIARNADGDPEGYVVFTLRAGRVRHPARSQEIRIRDLVWLTSDAYRSLWRFLAGHDLVGRVTWPRAPMDDLAPLLFAEPRMLRATTTEGCWFRINDIAPALEGRGYINDGELDISVDDDDLTPWNNGTWRLTVSDGNADVKQATTGKGIKGSIRSLTALYTGSHSARELAAAGLLRGDPDDIATAARLFDTPHKPHAPDNF